MTEDNLSLTTVPKLSSIQQHKSSEISRTAFEPSTWEEAVRIGHVMWSSGMLPKAVDSHQKALAMIVFGRERGLSVMQSLCSVHIIDAKPVMSADLMRAMVLNSGVVEYFRLVESTPQRATWEARRRNEPEPTTHTYTIEDATTAGLLGKDVWKRHPRAMLRARASAELCRIIAADVVQGVYTPEDDVEQAAAGTQHQAAPAFQSAQPEQRHNSKIDALKVKIVEAKDGAGDDDEGGSWMDELMTIQENFKDLAGDGWRSKWDRDVGSARGKRNNEQRAAHLKKAYEALERIKADSKTPEPGSEG